ncbi:MAG: alpha/beta fold hydrolase, partial [Proteobacteria bacterium]|nr:alpha/beta fold hydrolase [Pseudomonadota bacterium]
MPTRAGEAEARFAGSGEARVRYAERGHGRPVVLLHGALTCLEDMLLGPFDALADEFRVIAVDRPGHGLTPRPRLHGTLKHQGDRIRAALHELGVKQPIVVGHSRGGAVALSLALRYPEEIAGLVLLGPLYLPEARLEHALFGPRAAPGFGEVFNLSTGRLLDAAALPLLWEMMFAPVGMPEYFRDKFPFAMATRP